jgi:hypothetical protein
MWWDTLCVQRSNNEGTPYESSTVADGIFTLHHEKWGGMRAGTYKLDEHPLGGNFMSASTGGSWWWWPLERTFSLTCYPNHRGADVRRLVFWLRQVKHTGSSCSRNQDLQDRWLALTSRSPSPHSDFKKYACNKNPLPKYTQQPAIQHSGLTSQHSSYFIVDSSIWSFLCRTVKGLKTIQFVNACPPRNASFWPHFPFSFFTSDPNSHKFVNKWPMS